MNTAALLAWATRDKFSLAECEELAKDLDAFNTMTFDLVGPKGRKPAKWMDAYYGFFQIDGAEGFMSSAQFKYAQDLWCENLHFPEAPDRDASAIEARSDATGTGAAEGESAVAKPDAQGLPA